MIVCPHTSLIETSCSAGRKVPWGQEGRHGGEILLPRKNPQGLDGGMWTRSMGRADVASSVCVTLTSSPVSLLHLPPSRVTHRAVNPPCTGGMSIIQTLMESGGHAAASLAGGEAG